MPDPQSNRFCAAAAKNTAVRPNLGQQPAKADLRCSRLVSPKQADTSKRDREDQHVEYNRCAAAFHAALICTKSRVTCSGCVQQRIHFSKATCVFEPTCGGKSRPWLSTRKRFNASPRPTEKRKQSRANAEQTYVHRPHAFVPT